MKRKACLWDWMRRLRARKFVYDNSKIKICDVDFWVLIRFAFDKKFKESGMTFDGKLLIILDGF